MTRLPPKPQLEWSEDGVPRARGFDDVYFSARGGLAESDTVFLAGCGLPDAWREGSGFAICELGFGTGLNALALWRAWRTHRPAGALLHMVSIEAFPLAREDAARALSAFPEVRELAARLLARWPVRAYAPQRLWFEEDGFALTIRIGDAAGELAGLRGAFDAWFLDGFAPARNTGMWSPAVFAEIARLSVPGARAATFSVAGDVRRGLEAAGFSVEKKPGFGAKRERLEAKLQTFSLAEKVARESAPDEGRAEQSAALHPARPSPPTPSPQGRGGYPLYPYASSHPRRVAIIGAGIAGAACARALARRNVETIVLDAAPNLGAGASGNPAGLVMPRLDRGGGPMRELFLAAYLDAVAAYAELGAPAFTPCGVEERTDPRHPHVLTHLLDDPPLPPDWFARRDGAALHTRAGLVRPLNAIRAWLASAQLMSGAEVAGLERVDEHWLLRAPDGRAWLKADAIVLACGAALKRFEAARFLPLNLSRGQIEWGALGAPQPAHALLQSSYVAPFDGGVLFGATFDPIESDEPVEADAESRARNLEMLSRLAPGLAASVQREALQSRASIRATAHDFAPIAGLLPDAPAWLSHYAGIAQGRPPDLSRPAPAHANLFVLGGLGARGLTLAPLLGERIAAEMFGEPQTLSAKTLDAIHPARFLHRALRRGG
ncbi:MAG: FAD-dependent 5-carboxymethylaminomethyl-2-thiouridine(34) oxidoreductase MnmC [Pseudomonadota bacterium]